MAFGSDIVSWVNRRWGRIPEWPARAIGRPPHCEELPPDRAQGQLPAALLRFLAAANGKPATVTHAVQEVTRRQARNYAQWAAGHVRGFPSANRNPA